MGKELEFGSNYKNYAKKVLTQYKKVIPHFFPSLFSISPQDVDSSILFIYGFFFLFHHC